MRAESSSSVENINKHTLLWEHIQKHYPLVEDNGKWGFRSQKLFKIHIWKYSMLHKNSNSIKFIEYFLQPDILLHLKHTAETQQVWIHMNLIVRYEQETTTGNLLIDFLKQGVISITYLIKWNDIFWLDMYTLCSWSFLLCIPSPSITSQSFKSLNSSFLSLSSFTPHELGVCIR